MKILHATLCPDGKALQMDYHNSRSDRDLNNYANHLHACADCQAWLKELQAAADDLREIGVLEPTE